MHELIATQNILNLACQSAMATQANHVTDVYITIGQLSDITPESIQFNFDSISRETMCEGAQLHFEHSLVKMKCGDCQSIQTSNEIMVMCPVCGGEQLEILEGNEVRLNRIQAEPTKDLAHTMN